MFQQRGRAYTESRKKQIDCHRRQQQQRLQQIVARASTTTTTAATVTATTAATKAGGDGTGINIYKFKLKMANTLSVMTNVLRNVVSKQRIRYKKEGFNLDLAYIDRKIIAMGYPAENLESMYRNRLEDIYKFLEANHHDHYKIYNLCLERSYDINKFHGRVATFPFEDHNPPTIELIQKFCNDVDTWLNADSQNVAAVHCKAGKGRTGTMICCYLLFSKMESTAEDALACYDEKRTKDRKGVTIPSQRRYVQYFAKLIQSGLPYEKRILQFCEIRFTEASLLHSQGTVHCSISVLEDTACAVKVKQLQSLPIDFRKTFTLDLRHISLNVAGDIKVELTHKTLRKKIFHFWFNTFFVRDAAVTEGEGSDMKIVYTLSKSEIDDAHKDKEHKCFSSDFKVQLVFYAENSNGGGQPNVNSQISNHRKSQNARLPQQSSSSSSSNYQLPQNSSSGSDLNYICDQKSSSSASVSSLGRAGLTGTDGDELGDADGDGDVDRVRNRGRQSSSSCISNNQSSAMTSVVHDRLLDGNSVYFECDKYKAECSRMPYDDYICSSGPKFQSQYDKCFVNTSTPNQKHQHQQQQPQPQPQTLHNKSTVQRLSASTAEVVAMQMQQQLHQRQYQAPASISKGVNRVSNSTSSSNGNAKQSGTAAGVAANDSVIAVGGDNNSSKSSSISSHSSSATADNDEQEDWESANNFSHFVMPSVTTAAPTTTTTTTTTTILAPTVALSTVAPVTAHKKPAYLCDTANCVPLSRTNGKEAARLQQPYTQKKCPSNGSGGGGAGGGGGRGSNGTAHNKRTSRNNNPHDTTHLGLDETTTIATGTACANVSISVSASACCAPMNNGSGKDGDVAPSSTVANSVLPVRCQPNATERATANGLKALVAGNGKSQRSRPRRETT